MARIAELKAILDSRDLVLQIVRDEIAEVRAAYADERRTTIVEDEGEIDIEDLIADEPMVVTISNQGYAKRIPLDTYRQQGRGGKGITAMSTKDEDFVDNLFIASTHQYLLVLTEKGHLHWLKVHRLPKAGRTSKGSPLVNLIQIQPGDKIHAVVSVREFSENHYLAMATNKGIIKRTPLTAFSNVRNAGIIAINLIEGEHLIAARVTDGESDIIMAGSSGLAIRFHETDCRSMGRTARGVRGLALTGDQEVIGMVVVGQDDHDGTLLSITENGYGKRTPLDDYRVQRRGGKGLITIKCSQRNGPLMGIRDVREGEELMVITRGGIMIRMALDDVSQQGRNTQGVRIINLKGKDSVGSIAKISTKALAEMEIPGGENGEEGEVVEGEEMDAVTDTDTDVEETPEAPPEDSTD
jgi:DNA gyrase subunit A